jgi:hypothetical protein
MAAPNFLSGFFQGFAQTQERQKLMKQDEEERKARVKLYELQLDREKREQAKQQQQETALTQLFAKLQGTASAPAAAQSPPNGIPGAQGPVVAPEGAAVKPMTLTEMLADPQTAMLMLRTGLVKGDDLLKREDNAANRAMMQNLVGGAGAPAGMEMQGLKIGPSGELMPDFGQPQVTSPQTVMGPNGPELATFFARSGARAATLGTPKPDTVAPEVAGRISGLVQGKEIAGQVRSAYIRPDGSIDNALVMSAWGNVPRTKGRKVRNDILIAVDSVLRARTGAGVNVKEQDDVVTQFMPGPLDSDEGKLAKLDRLDQFIDGTLDIATLPPALRKRLEDAPRAGGGGKVIDFNSLPP